MPFKAACEIEGVSISGKYHKSKGNVILKIAFPKIFGKHFSALK